MGDVEDKAAARSKKKDRTSKSTEKKRTHKEKEKSRENRRARKERRKGKQKKEKESKEKRKKDRRKYHGSESSDGDSEDASGSEESGKGSGSEGENDPIQLCRDMLKFPNVAADLRQLFELIDSEQAVDISDLPDRSMKTSLAVLFRSLGLRKSPLGMYALPRGSKPTLDTLGFLLKDNPLVDPSNEGDPCEKSSRKEGCREEGGSKETPGEARRKIGPDMGPLRKERKEDESTFVVMEGPNPATGPLQTGVGENMSAVSVPEKETSRPLNDMQSEGGEAGEEDRRGEGSVIGPSFPVKDKAPQKRIIGPAMPPKEILMAAQQAMDLEEEDEEDGDMIGPMPPAIMKEAENATEAERFGEVVRIMVPDATAYDILGVNPQFSNSDLKKRYWKLSLLVHPDKCSHPQSQQAFTALNAAFKDLQDPTKKAVIDAKIANRAEKLEYEAELKAQKEAAEWRRLRGEMIPGDEELLNGPKMAPQRGTWMTELPPERQARQATTSTYFSRKEQTGRGDASEWTDTPAEKAKKARDMYLEGASQARLQGPESNPNSVAEAAKMAKTAALIDKYNASKRKISLLEKHQTEKEEAAQTKKSKKKSQKGDKEKGEGKEKQGVEAWEGNHPWRPWDRDIDLSAGRKEVKMDKDTMKEGLSSRFGSSNTGERKFL